LNGLFTWYWLADLCAQEDMPFVLGHALYMKAIHGGKAKNDTIDSQKMATLLRGGMLPKAYVYPAEMRATRDVLRRRTHLMRKRAELLAHVQNTKSQDNVPEIGTNIAYKANREGVAERFDDPAVQKTIEVDLDLITYDDQMLSDLELLIINTAQQHDANTLYLLQTVPGIGKILSLVLLYEIHQIDRFPLSVAGSSFLCQSIRVWAWETRYWIALRSKSPCAIYAIPNIASIWLRRRTFAGSTQPFRTSTAIESSVSTA